MFSFFSKNFLSNVWSEIQLVRVTSFLPDNLSGLKEIIFRPDIGPVPLIFSLFLSEVFAMKFL